VRSTKSGSLRAVGVALLLSAGAFAAAPASAFLVTVDAFMVKKNGAELFFDPFGTSGSVNPAPTYSTTPPNPASYSVFSSGLVPESNGKAVLDPTTNGGASATANGLPVRSVVVRLLTNDDPANTLGLKNSGMTFATGALFDIPSSFEPDVSSSFFLRFRERSGNTNLRDLQLGVFSSGLGTPMIRYRVQDFTDASVDTIAETPFLVPSGADQIELWLEKNTANNNRVVANFQFWANGSELGTSSTPLDGSADLFLRSGVVQPDFGASIGVVPLPPSALLMLAGLGALVAGARRRPRRG